MNDTSMVNRRGFISRTATLTAASLFSGQAGLTHAQNAAGPTHKFRLRYGPHPGTFKASAGNSPACKILFDIYHQQITEGNLIPNIDRCWDEIGCFQSGDNPGRKEPGTGEINFRNVFKYIHDRSKRENRDFVIGMEHGNSKPGKEGEQALIQAYREADAF